jgi:RHS repeat-associated protein
LEPRTLLATVNWVATSSGNWNVGSNWSTGNVPGSGDDAVIEPSAALTVTIDSGNQSVNSLQCGSNATLSISSGSLAVANGAEIDGSFQVNGTVTLAGTFSGGGSAKSQFSGGALTGGPGGATLGFPDFQWVGGTLAGTLTNQGTITAAGTGEMDLSGTLTNTGTIEVTGTGYIFSLTSGTTINNQSGAVFDFQSDAGLVQGNAGSFDNGGTLEKTGGTGTSSVQFAVNSSGGTFTNTSTGSLRFSGGGVLSGATIVSGSININGGTFSAADGSAIAAPVGGTGSLQVGGGTFSLAGSFSTNVLTITGGTLTGPGSIASGSQVSWTSGTLAGTLTNQGTITAAGTGEMDLSGTLTNTGTIEVTGTGYIFSLTSGTTINNQSGAVFDFQSDAGLVQGNGGFFDNAGTLEKTGGSGTCTIAFSLGGSGTVEADSGTLSFTSSVAQISGATLTSGTWNVFGGSTLNLANAGTITTNNANVTLSGPGSTFTPINGITANTGSFSILGGGKVTTAGAFSNQGSLTIGVASTLNVSGNYSQTSSASLAVQIAGTAGSGQFGRVVASGSAALNGTLAISLINGYGPHAGDQFQVVSYKSVTGEFPLINGLTFGRTQLFEVVTGDTNVVVNSLVDAGDLAVQSVSFTAPNNAQSGQDVTVSYVVTNDESTPTSTNSWVDSIYLGPTEYYGPSSRLIGRLPHAGALAGGASYGGSLTAPLPGVVPGDYHIFVICDSRGDVPDINRANNTLAAPNLISVGMPSLTPGVTASGTIDNGQDEYYQVNLPAGPVAQITANFAAAAGGELFVRYQNVPDQNTFDQMAFDPTQSQEQITLAGTQAGSYYVLLHGREGSAGGKPFSITVRELAFQVTGVTPAQGSNAGQATLTINGSELTPSTVVSLVAPDGTQLTASKVLFKDSTTLFATFDLMGLTPGSYGVRIADGVQTSTDAGAFTVTNAPPGQVSFSLSCSAYTHDSNPGTIVINYSNTGGTDVPAPLMILSADTNVSFELPGDTTLVPSSIQLLGINQGGPAGILPPGYQGTITLSFFAGSLAPHQVTNFTLSTIPSADTPFDWSTVESDLQPPTVPNDAWAAIYQNFTAAVGNTLGQYQQALDNDATNLSQLGEYTVDVSRLLSFELQKPDDFGAISQRYTLGAFGRGWPDPTDIKAVTDASGNVTIEYSGRVRSFFIQPDGSYQGVPGDAATLSLQNGVYTLRETDGSLTAFNPNGTLDYTQDTNGNKITANYAGGLLTSFVDSTGDTVAFSYDAAGRISDVTDPVGRVTHYSYDTTGQLLMSVSDASGTTSYAYGNSPGAVNANALSSITYPDGSQTLFSYDPQGRLKRQEADKNGDETVGYAYDGEGGISVTDAGGGTSTYFVNEFEQVGAYEDPFGHFTHFTYDANHNLVQETGPDGITTTFTNNAAGDTTSTTDPAGNNISATYDSLFNNLTSLTDPNGNSTQYAHDAKGNLLSITYPDSSQEQFSYDPTGNLTESVDRNGTAINYRYDRHNLLVEEDLADGSKITFSYDSHRNLMSATNSSGTTSFQYDSADRLKQVTYPNGMYLKFSYNLTTGQRTEMVDQTGFTVKYGYDALGRLSELTDGSDNLIVSYKYDGAGRLSEKDLGNGTYTEYGYDLAGDLTSIVNYKPDGTVLSSYVDAYDDLGRPISVTTLDGTTTYGYDATGQLTSVALPGGRTITYQYDPAGNRVAVTDNGVTMNYATNNLNEYTQVGSTQYAYDKDGNLVSSTDSPGTTSYTYNQLGQLVSVVSPQGTWTYQYDALGNRIGETQIAQETQYLIDPTGLGNVVGTFDGSGNLIDHYTQGLGLTSQVDATGAAAYYNFDLTGNTTELTGASGSVLNTYSYLPFGEHLSATGSAPNPFTYVGQFGVITDGCGQYLMRNRCYGAVTARFVEPDPVFLVTDANRYRYGDNSPVITIDPSGLQGAFVIEPGDGEPGDIRYEIDPLEAAKEEQIRNLSEPSLPASRMSVRFEQLPAQLPYGCTVKYDLYFNEAHQLYQFEPAPGPKRQHYFELTIEFGDRSYYFPVNPGEEYAVLDYPVVGTEVRSVIHGTPGQTFIGAPCDGVKIVYDEPAQPVPFDYGRFVREFEKRLSPCGYGGSEELKHGDPNNLIGPAGYGAGGFITPDRTLPYTILFANEPTADIPAQQVVVTEQVDPSLDWTTFEVGDFGIGGTIYAVPPNHGSYSTRLDLTSTLGIYLDVTAGINLATGMASWTFTSVDPTTGDLPSNIFIGFLPPDKNPPAGEAFVDYTIRPKSGLATGTSINARAVVVFDTNRRLRTPQVLNTIDATAPTSTVNPLPPAAWTTSFPVSWSGSDGVGSGIASYTIYVSDNGGSFAPWLIGTTQTSATFTGRLGNEYGFYSVATDNVGFVQKTLTGAQATTRIVPLVTVTSLTQEPMKMGTGKKAKKETVLVLDFSGALNAAAADNTSAYQLAPIIKAPAKGKGKHRKPPTVKLGPPVPPASAIYSASKDSVTLIPRGKLKPVEQLTVIGALVTDANGVPIDGKDDGQPGSNYVAVIGKSGVSVGAAADAIVASCQLPVAREVANSRLHAAAVDALLEQNNGDAFSVKHVARSERQFRDYPPADRRRARPDEVLVQMLQMRVEAKEELPVWPEWMPAADRFAVPVGPAPQTAGNWNPEITGLPRPGRRSEGSAERRKRHQQWEATP